MGAERYREAGVDLAALEQAKHRIAQWVEATRTPLVRGRPGGFAGLLRLPEGTAQPTLVLSTDGVGTKVLVALLAGRHDTVGQDLVHHCVNDILVHGARPLAFLDYIAGSAVSGEVLVALVEGIARACRAHGMALLGGETAQLPGLYEPGHYDLAGTIVGLVAEAEALPGERVRVGDLLVGYASSGLHTNGYSLARRILFEHLGLGIWTEVPELGGRVGEVLLAIHRSYLAAVEPVLARVHALAHITGGGIAGNLSRVLPPGCRAVVRKGSWPVPPLFRFLSRRGGVSEAEMFRVFNMGLGMIAVVAPSDVAEVERAATAAGVETWVVGEIGAGGGVELVGDAGLAR